MDRITILNNRKARLIAYLQMKLDEHDWHGVRDVCVDIEIIEAKLETLSTRPEISEEVRRPA